MVMLMSVKLSGVGSANSIDKKAIVCYYVIVMIKRITNTIKDKYYRYQPGEFLPIYSGSQMLNKREFHIYRIKWIINNHRVFMYQVTHSRG